MRFVLLLALLSSSAFAADPPCARYENAAVPKGDLPAASDAKKLSATCHPIEDYYGLGEGTPNMIRARKCALLERESGWKGNRINAGVLMMIYANGNQVTRNTDLAAHLICETNLTAPEKTKWVNYLESRRDKKPDADGTRIEFCERFYEDSYRSACADMRKVRQAAIRERKFKGISAKFSAAQKEKFQNLMRVAQEFFPADAVWKNPGHETGEARSELIAAHEAYAWEQFEIWLEHLEEEKRLKVPTETLADVDERLNKKYREYWRDLPATEKAQLTQAERLWIYFRDAFVDFAVLRYEPKDTNMWHAELTRQRIEELTF